MICNKQVLIISIIMIFALTTLSGAESLSSDKIENIGDKNLVISVQLNSELYGKDADEQGAILRNASTNTSNHIRVYENNPHKPSTANLRLESIKGQDYTIEGIYIKLRDTTGAPIPAIADVLQNYSIYYIINPVDEDLKGDISENQKWTKFTITDTDANFLRQGYIGISSTVTKDLKEGQFFALWFKTAPTKDDYIVVKQHKQIVGPIWVWSGASFLDIVDFPLLTFTNLSSYLRGEDTTLFGLIPFGTFNVSLFKYRFPDPNWTFPIVSVYGFLDPTTISGLRGSIIGGTTNSFASMDSLISSIGFGVLFGLSSPAGTFYAGYGARLNSIQLAVTLDHGFVVAASVFDLVGLLTKLQENVETQ